jgi:glyoxylase-like metal-dependent hydrolase (beta-lactamase superfamily II)
MKIGDWSIRSYVDADVALDGGSMFGVVPKPLWERQHPADERNRIAMVTRLLLLQGHGRRILVDTGLGDRWSEKARDIYAISSVSGGIRAQLETDGIDPGSITDVILTHLHFDHAGGTTIAIDDGLELAFPAAVHHVQRRQWEWALSPSAKDSGSFRRDDYLLLGETEGALRLVEGAAELFPGLSVEPLDGHTAAMQSVLVSDGEQSLYFPSDLLPTAAHVRAPYIMAFDNEPLRTLSEKQRWLRRAAEGRWTVVLQHDRDTAAIRLGLDDGVPVVRERVEA